MLLKQKLLKKKKKTTHIQIDEMKLTPLPTLLLIRSRSNSYYFLIVLHSDEHKDFTEEMERQRQLRGKGKKQKQ